MTVVALPKTIAEHIDCLARMTGAPDTFVGQVKQLFATKGIPLESDATPYLSALDEAFRREESIRTHASSARRNIAEMQEHFSRIGQSYVRQLEQLKKVRAELRRQGRQQHPHRVAKDARSSEVTVPGDHRSYVTRVQQETLPLVPGPKEPQ